MFVGINKSCYICTRISYFVSANIQNMFVKHIKFNVKNGKDKV